MQKTEEFCVDESGWIHCPFCKCRTRTKIRADTSLKNFPIFCPKCKQECLIDVDNMKIRLSVVPDAKTQSRYFVCVKLHDRLSAYSFEQELVKTNMRNNYEKI